jgi:hypothetical protein
MRKNVLFDVCVCVTVLSTLHSAKSQISDQRTKAITSKRIGDPTNAESEVRTKDILDVRDYGVDCTFTHNSSAALNAITATAAANGAAITFPPNCHIKLASTWLVKNLSAFNLRGVSGSGSNGYYATNIPTISWCGAAGGTMVDMEYVDGFIVENLAIDGGGNGCANSASVGINVDKFGFCPGCVNTTDGRFRRMMFNGSATGVPASQANFTAIQFSMLQANNVENMEISDSAFQCGGGASSAGIIIGPSANAKGYVIQRNNFNSCKNSIDAQLGSNNLITRNFFTTMAGGSDLLWQGSGSLTFSYNRTEPTSSTSVPIKSTGLYGGGCSGLILLGNEFAVAGRSGGGGTTIDGSNCTGRFPVILIGNIWDTLTGEVPIKGNGGGPTLVSLGNWYPNTTTPLFRTFAFGGLSFSDVGTGFNPPFAIFGGTNLPFKLFDINAATGGANTNGVQLHDCASIWNGSVAVDDCWIWTPTVGAGANPTSTYTLTHTGSSGQPLLDLSANPVKLAPFTATLATGLLTTGTCAAAVTVAVTGAATTSVVSWDYASDPSGVVGYGSSGGLTVTAYATSGNANFRLCNPTAGSITPGAMTLNFRIIL